MKKFFKLVFKLLCLIVPHKKTILFESNDNKSDNGFVLALYVASLTNYKKYKLVFVGKKDPCSYNELPKGLKYLCFSDKGRSYLKFLILSYRAKYIFFSYDNFWKYIKLPKKIKICFIRHGAFPIKDVGNYYNSIFDNENDYYCLSNTKFVEEKLNQIYHKENVKYFLSGMPRCDLLYKQSKKDIRSLLGIRASSKIILIACTFRNFYKQNISFFESEFPIHFNKDEIINLNKRLAKNNTVLLFKLHHAQLSTVCDSCMSNIFYVNNQFLENHGLNNYDLFNCSDCLITDYSNIFMDYLLTDKPIAFLVSDKSSYESDRGFTLQNFTDYLPGKLLENKECFINYIFNSSEDADAFLEKRKEARNSFIGEYDSCCEFLMKQVEKL